MRIVIVTPAKPGTRHGNRNTALRWAAQLRALGHTIDVVVGWSAGPHDLMIALHARRSHASMRAWKGAHPDRPLVLLLTGTDLYRDIRDDANALESMELATRMIVLQDMGLRELAPTLRRKTRVIYQSCESIARQPVIRSCFEIIISGHLRAEKDPFCAAAALAHLPAASGIRITQIGGSREPALAGEARAWMKREPRYLWLGELRRPHALATLARGRAMLIRSHMEGGANVVSEALMARVPVIASRIPGNVGMLGKAYAGYYPAGNARALARLLRRLEIDPDLLQTLRRQCAVRRKLISRSQERIKLRALITECANKSL